MTTICIADRLVRGDGVDPEITDVLDRARVVVVPVANPDGYVYTWTEQRLWRKNRRGGHGVDLNRNFSVGWGGYGSSARLEASDYRGEAALSEPESVAIAEFIAAEVKLVGHIGLAHVWGIRALPVEPHRGCSGRGGRVIVAGGPPWRQRWRPRTVSPTSSRWVSTCIRASGVLSDWSYGEAGLMAITAELRPAFYEGGFVAEPEAIEPTCDETLAGAMELFRWAAYEAEVPETTGGDSTGTGTGTSEGGTTAAATDDTGDAPSAQPSTSGCSCRTTSGGLLGWLWLLVLAVGQTRRRSRSIA